MATWTRASRSPLVVQCAVYVAFALPIATLGAGWPDRREQLDQPSGVLGLLVSVYSLGRLSTAPIAHPLLERFRARSVVPVLLVVLAVSCLGLGWIDSFVPTLCASAVVGMTSGALDSIGNRFQAIVGRARDAGLMFGSYGVGATLGPPLVALGSWRLAFTCSAVLALLATALASSAVRWPAGFDLPSAGPRTTRRKGPSRTRNSIERTRRDLFTVLVCIGLYSALEVSTGAWMTSYLREGRGVDASISGIGLSLFWGGVTGVRLLIGRSRSSAPRIMVTAAVATSVAYGLVVSVPSLLVAPALLLVGMGLAPMFPTLVATTAQRVGAAAARVSGLQLLAGNIGATVVSAGFGLVVDAAGPRALAATFLGLSVIGVPILLRCLAVRAAGETGVPSPGTLAGPVRDEIRRGGGRW